jgi:putative RNA 2'-phosphotransferase
MGKNKDKSKRLAFLLRHDKEYDFKKEGWREISDLIKNHGFSKKELEEIVKTDDKNRYEFSEDMRKIRARQGHSIPVEAGLVIKTPPNILYHGTAKRFLESIKEKGILKMSRVFVQLTENKETALKVGSRHGDPIILVIDTKKMVNDGITFKLSSNNVWLVNEIKPEYILWEETIWEL